MWYGWFNCGFKKDIIKKQKEIGYEVGSVAWHNLDGYQELWNKADFETKEKIVNEQGKLAIELVTPLVSNQRELLIKFCNALFEQEGIQITNIQIDFLIKKFNL